VAGEGAGRGPRAGLAARCATRCSAALGYFVTESSEHFSEYVPWFIKRDRPDLLEQFDIPLDEYIAARCRSPAGSSCAAS
jgi:alpha-galactosidase/6-phospho-beta-glucosidase family protein